MREQRPKQSFCLAAARVTTMSTVMAMAVNAATAMDVGGVNCLMRVPEKLGKCALTSDTLP